MTLPLFRVSPSTLNLASCGRALQNKLNKVPADSPPYENQQIGKDTHGIFHAINNYPDKIDDDILDKLVAENVQEHFIEARNYGLMYMRNYPDKPTVSEFKMALTLDLEVCDYDAPEAAYVSVIDRAEIEAPWARILDHKLTWQMGDPLTFQTSYYAWMLWKTFPEIQDIETGIHYVRYGIHQVEELYHEDLIKIERGILARAQRAWANTSKDAKPGRHCQYCSWALSCPAAKSNLHVIKTREDAERMAGALRVGQRQVLEYQNLLKKWVDKHGPVNIDEEICYGYAISKSVKPVPDSLGEAIINTPDIIEKLKLSKGDCKKFNVDTTTTYGSRWSVIDIAKGDE